MKIAKIGTVLLTLLLSFSLLLAGCNKTEGTASGKITSGNVSGETSGDDISGDEIDDASDALTESGDITESGGGTASGTAGGTSGGNNSGGAASGQRRRYH